MVTVCCTLGCDDDDGTTPVGDVLVRINNLSGGDLTDVELGFFGTDALKPISQPILGADEVSEFVDFEDGGSCDFYLRFLDLNGNEQLLITPCRCICLIGEGEFEASVRRIRPADTSWELVFQELE